MSNLIKDAVDKLVGMTPAPAVAKGLSTGASGNATSGLDSAMSAHADQVHPTNGNIKNGRAVSIYDEK